MTNAFTLGEAEAGEWAARRKRAAAKFDVSPTKFDDLVKRGLLPKPFRIDGCVLWDLQDLREAYERLKDAGEDGTSSENPWDKV